MGVTHLADSFYCQSDAITTEAAMFRLGSEPIAAVKGCQRRSNARICIGRSMAHGEFMTIQPAKVD